MESSDWRLFFVVGGFFWCFFVEHCLQRKCDLCVDRILVCIPRGAGIAP